MAIQTQTAMQQPKYTPRQEKPLFNDIPMNIKCGYCKKLVRTQKSHGRYAIQHINPARTPAILHFCNKECKNKWVEVQRK